MPFDRVITSRKISVYAMINFSLGFHVVVVHVMMMMMMMMMCDDLMCALKLSRGQLNLAHNTKVKHRHAPPHPKKAENCWGP